MLRKYLSQENIESKDNALVPLRYVGPLKLNNQIDEDQIFVPLATYESPLWPSVDRGFRVTRKCGGIGVWHQGQIMSRSFILNAASTSKAIEYKNKISLLDLTAAISSTSRFAKQKDIYIETMGRHIFVRLTLETGDAAGHNMVTKAANAALSYILEQYKELEYGSISGNLCTDKKVSAINSIYGRGHNVIANAIIPAKICQRMIRVTPERLKQLHLEKNLIGSMLAGSLRSANAHIANMLLAFYLATGQDAANIVEGSQSITDCNVTRDGSLEITCHIPNLIVGTIGNGKDLAHVWQGLEKMGCLPDGQSPGQSSARLAMICAATCLAGELSLLAAQTNEGELIHSHEVLERQSKNR